MKNRFESVGLQETAEGVWVKDGLPPDARSYLVQRCVELRPLGTELQALAQTGQLGEPDDLDALAERSLRLVED